jgi:hypothetical protein
MDVYAPLNLHQNTISAFAIETGIAFPLTPVLGQHWVLTPSNVEYYWNGTVWAAVGAGPSTSFAATIGDGLTLIYPVVHNLGTLDTVESVYSIATGLEEVAAIQHTSLNVTTFTFSIAPLLNSVRVVIKA